MKTLPPARCGVSSCSINCRARTARAGFSERTSTLFERGSATSETRSRRSGAPGCPPPSPCSLFSIATMSSADAYLTGTIRGSPNGGWSSDATIRRMRFTLSA